MANFSFQKMMTVQPSLLRKSSLLHLFYCSRVNHRFTSSLSHIQGVETTTTALTYVSYALAKYPEIQAQLAEELSSYSDIDSLDPVGLEKLPLLNSVIRESLRLWPPAPAPLPRLSPPQGVILGGYYIPGGVSPCLNQSLTIRFKYPARLGRPVEILKSSLTQIHLTRNGPTFSSRFADVRWIGLSRDKETEMWDQNMIFSYGPRVCLGKE